MLSNFFPKFNYTLINKAFPTIFMDYQSTTPIDPRVLDKMLPYMTVRFGNAHSRSHQYGWEDSNAINEARK